jgi:hypothetical protein
MAKRAKAQPSSAPAAIDPSAPGAVLEYVGGRTGRHVPARDLEGVDLARIAYRRAAKLERADRSRLVRPGEQRPAPKRPGPAAAAELEAIATELVATGAFIRTEQPEPADPATTPEA